MSDASINRLDEFSAPYGKEVILEDVNYESGLCLLRIRIREGNRFTIMDIDSETARHWGSAMLTWADSAST